MKLSVDKVGLRCALAGTSSRLRSLLLTGLFVLSALMLQALAVAATASAAKGRVYEIPNLASPGLKPSIKVRLVLPSGMTYVPEHASRKGSWSDGNWFNGGGYSAIWLGYDKLNTAYPDGTTAWGFGWQKTVPLKKCSSPFTASTVGGVHLCQALCRPTAPGCYQGSASQDGRHFTHSYILSDDLWKPAADGGYLYLGLQVYVKRKLRTLMLPFTEALAIIKGSNRVG